MPAIKKLLFDKLNSFEHQVLEVTDESHNHSRGLETHFKILMVAPLFEGMPRLDRARWLNDVLKDEIARIHSVTQRLIAPSEWAAQGDKLDAKSPLCQGANSKGGLK
jgi:BolA protein